VNIVRVNDWLQVFGLFGVIASLIFVGLQMMQDREIALSAIFQERAASATELYLEMASNDTLRLGMIKVAEGQSDQLTPLEQTAIQAFALAGKQMADNSFYQYQQGFAPEEHWLQIKETMKSAWRNSVSREAVLNSPMRPSFREEIERINRELEAEAR